MRGAAATNRSHVLIVGDSGDASLLAALERATLLDGNIAAVSADSTGEVVWVRSVSAALALAGRYRISRILIDSHLIADEKLLPNGGARSIPRASIVEELERRFERVFPAPDENPERFADYVRHPAAAHGLFRRSVELFVATLGILLLAPLLLCFGICYRLVFGPTSFFQRIEYVGRNEEPLWLYRFAPYPLRITSDSTSGRVAQSIDRNLKRTHLHGAPALLQVISGRLALVGPTPFLKQQYRQYASDFPMVRARTYVCPGLVSLARIRLRQPSSEYDVLRSIEYDMYYMKYRSLRFDAHILFRSISIVISDVLATAGRISRTSVSLVRRAFDERRSVGKAPGPSQLAPPPMPVRSDGSAAELIPTLLIGAGAGASLLVGELQSNLKIGFWPIALVDDEPGLVGRKIRGVPVLGTTSAAVAIGARERVGAVIIAIPSASQGQMQRLVKTARDIGVPVYAMPEIGRILRGTDPTALVPVVVTDLLGRPVVEIDAGRAKELLQGKRVLVTGAVGSIGREVVLQALRGEPTAIYGLDINESDLYDLQQELRTRELATEFMPVVGSVCDAAFVERVMQRVQPQVVFHAAAYKHVPLMEDFPYQAVRTNIGGTHVMVTAAARHGVERFVMVSTDKAVNPTSVMGATKRVAELIVQETGQTSPMSTCSVRFGNVLGSRGSVVPLFERQIESGGPITVTDPRMKRYFMTIPEAAGLIIEAGAFGDRGVVYMLDMGEPVRIVDLAERLIELKGLRPGIDIAIEFSGLRPGEKLFEELALDFEQARTTEHPKIRILEQLERTNMRSGEAIWKEVCRMIDQASKSDIRETLLHRVHEVDQVEPKGESGAYHEPRSGYTVPVVLLEREISEC